MDTKLQARDITELKSREDELISAINAHDKRIRALETAGSKSKAEKWDRAIGIVMQTLIVACLGVIMAKVGL